MKKKKSKVSIVGAGNVGAATAFSMAINQTASELVLIDINRGKAEGEVMDINHGLCFLGQMNIYAGTYADVADSDLIIITAGMNRKPGETRLDLAKKNVGIAREITAEVMKHYTTGVILVVSNPVDVLTYMIQKWSGLPQGMVMGSGTILDSSRFRFSLAQRLNTDIKNIHAYVLGEHGDSQFPAWSLSNVFGTPLDSLFAHQGIKLDETVKEEIAAEVRGAGASIIKGKGATYYAVSICINDLAESIIKNQNTIRTVSTLIDGAFGVTGCALSLPSYVYGNGVQGYLDIPLSDAEIESFRGCAEAVKAIIKDIVYYDM